MSGWKKVGIGILVFLYLCLGVYLITSSIRKREDPARSGVVTLRLAIPSTRETDEIIYRHVDEFERKNPDIRVEVIPVAGDYYQKVLVMIAGNIAPDLMWMGQSFAEFADRGVFLDLSGRVESSEFNLTDYHPEVLKWYRRGNAVYSLPFGIDLETWIYNRRHFRDAGLRYPKDDWTYEEFLTAATALTRYAPDGRVERYAYRGTISSTLFGAHIFDPETGEVTVNSPAMLDFYRHYLDLVYRYRAKASAAEDQEQNKDALSYFRQGKVSILQIHTWDWPRIPEMLKEVDWNMTLAPKARRQSQWASSQAYCIYRDTGHPDEAWRLFKVFQEPDFQLEMARRMVPPIHKLAEKLVEEPPPGMPDNFKVILKALDVLAPTPRVPHLQELMSVYGRANGLITTRRETPEQALRDAEIEMKRRMEKFAIQDAEDRRR